MRIGIICSKWYEEKFNLRVNQLLKDKNIPMIEIPGRHLDFIDGTVPKDYDYLVAITIHSLRDRLKLFTVHPSGNWNGLWSIDIEGDDTKDLGGKPGKLSMISPSLLKFTYNSLIRNNDLPDFSVCLEATHHGPDVSVPVLNLEIGSNQEAWEDEKAAEVIVKVVQDILANFKPNKRDASIVVGGDHYMRNIVPLMQNRLGNQEIINDKIVIGHMCPSNQVDNFTKETLAEAISKTDVLVKDVIIDLAAVGQHALRLKKIITNAGLEVKYLHKIIVSD